MKRLLRIATEHQGITAIVYTYDNLLNATQSDSKSTNNKVLLLFDLRCKTVSLRTLQTVASDDERDARHCPAMMVIPCADKLSSVYLVG